MCLDPKGTYSPSLRHKALSPPAIHVCVCPPRVHPSLYLMGPKRESAGRKTNLESMSSWEVKPTRSLVRERVGLSHTFWSLFGLIAFSLLPNRHQILEVFDVQWLESWFSRWLISMYCSLHHACVFACVCLHSRILAHTLTHINKEKQGRECIIFLSLKETVSPQSMR